MKRFLISLCILFALCVNVAAVSFPSSATKYFFSSEVSAQNLQNLSFSSVSSYGRDEDEEKANDLFAGLIALLIIVAGIGYYWFNNVRFFDYPYADESSPADGNYVARGNFEGLVFTDPGYSRNRFSLDTSLVYLHNLGLGNETRFEGLLFPYIGPYFENLALGKIVTNGNYSFEKSGFRDNLKLGAQISLFQANILSVAFLIQFTTWRGGGFENFRKGCNVGLLLRSYPIKPVVIEWKIGSQNYTHDFIVFESDLHFGIMRGACDFFASWNYLHFFNNENDDYSKDFSGGKLGIRRYFKI